MPGFDEPSQPGDIENLWKSIFEALSPGILGGTSNLMNMESFLKYLSGGAAYERGGYFSDLGKLAGGTGGLGPYITGTAFPALQDLAAGITPEATKRDYRQQARSDRAAITESMGSAGARLGTDITKALEEQSARSRTDLAALSEQQIIDAANAITGGSLGAQGIKLGANELIQQGILGASDIQQKGQLGALGLTYGLGSELLGTEFTRAESALQRELEKYGIDVSAESGLLEAILQLILSGGFGGGE